MQQLVSACQVIVNRLGQETPVGRQVSTKSFRITLSGPTLKVEARSRNEADYHHVLTYDMGSKAFSTDRSTEQLASAATYFGAIVSKIREQQQQLIQQRQQLPLKKDRHQGLEL